MPSTALRRALRGHGHALSAIVQIGKAGVTEPLVKQLAQALHDHELVKVKIGSECPDDRFAVAERLSTEPGVQIAQILGRTILLYKRHPFKPRYEGKRAAPQDEAVPEKKKKKRPPKKPIRSSGSKRGPSRRPHSETKRTRRA